MRYPVPFRKSLWFRIWYPIHHWFWCPYHYHQRFWRLKYKFLIWNREGSIIGYWLALVVIFSTISIIIVLINNLLLYVGGVIQ